MFIDILGRIKQWTGIVQNKLDACKNEIGNLRKELLARACEMDVKTREMEDLKVQITDYQNALQLNGESLKKDNIKVRSEQEEEKIRKKIHAEEFLAEDAKEIKNPKIKDTVRTVDQIKEEDEENNAESAEAINHQETVRDAKEIDRTKKNVIKNPIKNPIKNTLQAADQIDEEVKRAIDMAAPTTLQEKTKREFELESEITQLRKEYDRVIKERAEYENAIQRALLRGVSSLNVEALRVLRCPPIPCCAPCAPCPATAGIIPTEPVVLCPAKNAKRRSGSAAATASSAKVPRDRNGDQTDCTTKWPCASPCCLAGRNRKSANGSMIFLLRQGNGENLYDEDTTPVCGSTVVKKIELPPLRKFET
ncbi:centrosomal protein POC5-like [Formica exsecta]|uniref:centrosomal protein POC5-like n=1 Tax=Formica exsecta TaxID=72781 RepID=UPI00114267A6|nr:centrosomal protein POC5-like [Formica exsecta]